MTISPSRSAFASWSRARARCCGGRGDRSCRPKQRRPGSVPVEIHGLHIDPARRRVRVKGEDVDLTAQEFRLLHVLATHPGIVFSREALLTRVWPDHTFVTERSVDSLVKRSAPAHREGSREPGNHPDRVGQRLQGR